MIHPTAVISRTVQLGVNVDIGPYVIIDGNVEIGDGCVIGPHAHISGDTRIGARTRVHTGAIIGDRPQDHSYTTEAKSYTTVGRDCTIREYVTIHRGAEPETTTAVGDNVLLMVSCHVAHNCQIGDCVNIANGTVLAGHIHIGHHAFVSGLVAMHQFVRIGPYAMISGQARVPKDVPPYCLLGDGNRIYGANVVGLRRAGFTSEQRRIIRDIIKRYFFRGLNRDTALAEIETTYPNVDEAIEFSTFIRSSDRGTMSGTAKSR